ncbi:MAG: hypothetical protein V2A74_08405 [bacterium]
MTRNARKKWLKIVTTERFNLFQSSTDPTTFEVSWKKSRDYGRRRFKSENLESALRQAPIVAGLVTGQERVLEVKLADAFNEVLAQTSRRKRARHDWLYQVSRFLRWLVSSHPDCTHWHLMTRQIVRQYLDTYNGKSATTRRLAMQPISQTSGYMHREYGFTDLASRLGVGSKLKSPPMEVYVTDVADFLNYLRDEDPVMEAGVALQGLAGLQLQEVTRLTWNRVNLDRGLIEISGEVKNEYRNRVIPVCKRVVDALRAAGKRRQRGSKILCLHEEVVTSPRGLPYGDNWVNYSKLVTKALRKWNPGIEWKPKDLRNCLPTFAVMHGLLNDVWEQYIGHAPKSVTARHYIPRLASRSTGEGEALRRQTNLFELHVTEPLNRAVLGEFEVKILNNFEREASNQRICSKS